MCLFAIWNTSVPEKNDKWVPPPTPGPPPPQGGPEHPPVCTLLQALDVQLAEEEPLMVCCVRWRLRDRRAALGWRGPRPPRGLSWLFGSRPSSGLGSVPRSRPVWTGSLLWETIGQAGDLAASLRGNVRFHASKQEGLSTHRG